VSVAGRTPSLQARAKVKRVCMSWRYSCRTVIERKALCMSTTIIRGVVRCFSLISEDDKEFASSMLISAGKGRAKISW
jgi:hypothetical protein